jgi:hypothetical protein
MSSDSVKITCAAKSVASDIIVILSAHLTGEFVFECVWRELSVKINVMNQNFSTFTQMCGEVQRVIGTL